MRKRRIWKDSARIPQRSPTPARAELTSHIHRTAALISLLDGLEHETLTGMTTAALSLSCHLDGPGN